VSDVEAHKNEKFSANLYIDHANHHKHKLAQWFQLMLVVVEVNQRHGQQVVEVDQICTDTICDLEPNDDE
jgi:copper oxidase (laccase) domain-containing protein